MSIFIVLAEIGENLAGRVAQVVEQRPFKPWVAGSSPAALIFKIMSFIFNNIIALNQMVSGFLLCPIAGNDPIWYRAISVTKSITLFLKGQESYKYKLWFMGKNEVYGLTDRGGLNIL